MDLQTARGGTQMKARIEKATSVLVRKPLWDSTRAADLASFAFGARRSVPSSRSGNKTIGEYGLHIQCAWRITRREQIVVGSRDLYYPAIYGDPETEIPPDFDWDRDANRRDKLLRTLFEGGTREYIVDQVHVGPAASLHIVLSDDLCLDIFPDDSLNSEYWRLFRPGVEEPHFVVGNGGVET